MYLRKGTDVVARAAYVGDGKEYCRLTGCRRYSSHTSFQGGHALLKHLVGGVCYSGIYVPRALELEKLSAVLHVVECIGCTLIYGNGSSL